MFHSAGVRPYSDSLSQSFLYSFMILNIYLLPLFIINKIVLFTFLSIYKQFKKHSVFLAPRIREKPVALACKNRYIVSEGNKIQIHIQA